MYNNILNKTQTHSVAIYALLFTYLYFTIAFKKVIFLHLFCLYEYSKFNIIPWYGYTNV